MEKYGPVVSFSLVRIFIYMGLCLRMCIAQLDVNNALINGEVTEDVWVMAHRGIPGVQSRCYKLRKSMYVSP